MTDKTTDNIAKKLKEYRLKNKFSQAELAGKAGIAPNTLARLERGEHRASSLTIEKLAKALKVKASDILSY